MTAPMVLLPVFVLVALTFVLLFWMGPLRTRDSVPSNRGTQVADCFNDQFALPVLFYVLVALALPLRHADLIFVLLSWVFVLLRILHTMIFVTSNDARQRSLVWLVGAVVLAIMWLYFALSILFGI